MPGGSIRTATHRRAGFTLLEVIVALIIAVLAASALYRAIGTGMRATADASMYEQAIVRARSHLASAADGAKLVPGEWQGDDGGGFHWYLRVVAEQTATVRPFGFIGPQATSSLPVVLYRVVVAMSWQVGDGTKQVVLQTERIGGA